MAEEMTTIQVFKQDAEAVKRLLPHLRSDAYRISKLLETWKNTQAASTVPRPAETAQGASVSQAQGQ
jgi:putative heme degradation protein